MWMGYLLALPLRRLIQDPQTMMSPFIIKGMTVLEIGPGMGFFTLPIAKTVGPTGRVIATDIQRKMIDALRRRVQRAGMDDRMDYRLSTRNSLKINDIENTVDFTLAFAVVHEIPDKEGLFRQLHRALKAGARLFVADPKAHCSSREFDSNISLAKAIGFSEEPAPEVRNSYCMVLRKV